MVYNKYAAVITHNAITGMALAIAVKNADGIVVPSDSGTATTNQPEQLEELKTMLETTGFTVQVIQTSADLLTQAQGAALALAGTL